MESADVRAVVLAVCSNILRHDLPSKQSQKNGNGVLFAVKVKCPCMAHEHKLHIAHECDAKHTEPARLHGDLHLYCLYEVGATQNSFRLMTHPRTKHTRGFIMHKTSTDWCLMCPSHSRRAQWIHVMFVCTNTHTYIYTWGCTYPAQYVSFKRTGFVPTPTPAHKLVCQTTEQNLCGSIGNAEDFESRPGRKTGAFETSVATMAVESGDPRGVALSPCCRCRTCLAYKV